MTNDMGAKFILDTSGPPLHAPLKEDVYLVKLNLLELNELGHTRLEGDGAWVEPPGASSPAEDPRSLRSLLDIKARFW